MAFGLGESYNINLQQLFGAKKIVIHVNVYYVKLIHAFKNGD
jgi:hypothetical protein